jgi:minor histocompatibility antigen H13
MLTALYFAFKYFSKTLLNKILNGYLSLAGFAGFVRFALYLFRYLPFKLVPLSISLWKQKSSKVVEGETRKRIQIEFTLQQVVCILLAAIFTAAHLWYKHWTLSNLFGLVLSFNAISLLKLDSFKTGYILLFGLFLYDIGAVFASPMMVYVAQNFEAPVKIVWPRQEAARTAFAMLGLGASMSYKLILSLRGSGQATL